MQLRALSELVIRSIRKLIVRLWPELVCKAGDNYKTITLQLYLKNIVACAHELRRWVRDPQELVLQKYGSPLHVLVWLTSANVSHTLVDLEVTRIR